MAQSFAGLVSAFGSKLPQCDDFAELADQACGRFGFPLLMGREFVQEGRHRRISGREYVNKNGRFGRG